MSSWILNQDVSDILQAVVTSFSFSTTYRGRCGPDAYLCPSPQPPVADHSNGAVRVIQQADPSRPTDLAAGSNRFARPPPSWQHYRERAFALKTDTRAGHTNRRHARN